MTTRPRLLFYSVQPAYPFWGGSEKFWYESILDERLRRQFDCHVILSESSVTHRYGEHLRSLGVDVQPNPLIRSGGAASPHPLKRVGRRLVRLVRPEQPNLEQQFWSGVIIRSNPALVWFNLADLSGANFLQTATAVCRDRGIPYWLIVQHAFEHFFLFSDDLTEDFMSILSGAKRVVCVSERNRAALERSIGQRLENIWLTTNAVSREFLDQAAAVAETHPVRLEGPARLLNLARFDPTFKGQHILLEALADARWKRRDWRLIMQGWGNLTRLLERLIAYYGLPASHIELRRFTHDVLPIIAASDLLALPSLSEGTPFALVESMACARPAVGTPVGGIPELITEGETGWLARSTEVADVADALERAWSARPQWRIMGSNAQSQIFANYNQHHTVIALIEMLNRDISR